MSDQNNSNKVFIGKNNTIEDCNEFSVVLNGETSKVKRQEGESIIDSLVKAGVSAPYSCMSGSCMACMGKITSGAVYQEDLFILSQDNVDDNECLTCQSIPCSNNAVINYDEI